MNHGLKPLKPYTPDLSIEGAREDVLLERGLLTEIKTLSGIDEVFGRMYLANIPASKGETTNTATLLSYDAPQFAWAERSLASGNIENVLNGGGVLVDYGYAQENNWKIGDSITLTIGGNARDVIVAGIASDAPVDAESGEWIIICSESTFTALTGIEDYKVIDIQVSSDISGQVRNLLTPDMKLLDLQQHNNEVRTSYYAMAVFIYGFLIIIAFIALINIVNTVGASVSSRMNNYGVMRAVGMSGRQLKKIITAEAAAYAVTGCIVGSVLGLLLHNLFFGLLITSNWGAVWQPPVAVLTVIILAALLTTFISVISPAKKIEEMSIVNVVNAG
jgi:putative ABC transport system permease protein